MKHKVLKQVEEQDYKEVEMNERERERYSFDSRD